MTMLAFPNNDKPKYLTRVRAHRAADEIVQGTGYENGRGCAVGCTLDRYDHQGYPDELGVPIELARLQDVLHERLPAPDYKVWPERFLAAIAPGADLSRVWAEWAIWMLVDDDHGVLRFSKGRPDCESAIRRVADLWRTGGSTEEFRAARRSAAADAAAAAAAYAADAAAAYAADAYAKSKWALAASDKLVQLLEAAPIP